MELFSNPFIIDASYTPVSICSPCSTLLNRQLESLITPTIWREPDANHERCYACMIPSLIGSNWNERRTLHYPLPGTTTTTMAVWRISEVNIERERSPLPGGSRSHTPTNSPPTPVPSIPDQLQHTPSPSHIISLLAEHLERTPSALNSIQEASSVLSSILSSITTQSSGEMYEPPRLFNEVRNPMMLFTQEDFLDLSRRLRLTKEATEILGSALRQKNVLAPGVSTTILRGETVFTDKFDEKVFDWGGQIYTIAYITDVEGLFEIFGVQHNIEDWRLFIDGSTTSLKAMLLHNGNIYPSIPMAYSRRLPEKYENMVEILKLIKYQQYRWKVIADFKLINILTGLGPAQSKFPCYLCLWDKNAEDRYNNINWQPRPEYGTYDTKKYSAHHKPLVCKENILLPPLHIKLGLVNKLFSKIYEQNEEVREVLRRLTRISEAKIKMGVYDGPKIKVLFNSTELPQTLSKDQNKALSDLKEVCANFLGNNRSLNYEQLIGNMMESYKKLGINVSLKMHSLLSHLDQFPPNCGDYSDEQGERAHQDFRDIEKQFLGKSMASGLSTYCNSLIRQTDPTLDRRQTSYIKTKYFFCK